MVSRLTRTGVLSRPGRVRLDIPDARQAFRDEGCADTFLRSAPLPFATGAKGTAVRRWFDHLVVELSVAVRCVLPRYALWLHMRECGLDPEHLSKEEVLAFCDAPVTAFLAERGLYLPIRARRRLLREIARFDPSIPTPYERFARI